MAYIALYIQFSVIQTLVIFDFMTSFRHFHNHHGECAIFAVHVRLNITSRSEFSYYDMVFREFFFLMLLAIMFRVFSKTIMFLSELIF